MQIGSETINAIRLSFRIRNQSSKSKFLILTTAHVLTAFLDVIGITLVGILGNETLNLIRGSDESKSKTLSNVLRISNLTSEQRIMVIGGISALVFLVKTIISIILTQKLLRNLAKQSSEISVILVAEIFRKGYEGFRKMNPQEIVYATTEGTKHLVLGIQGTFYNIVVETSLVIFIFISLMFVNLALACFSILFIVLVAYSMYIFMQKRSLVYGHQHSQLSIESHEKIWQTLMLFRELVVFDKQREFFLKIGILRSRIGVLAAKISFQPYISKYAIEAIVVVGSIFLAVIALLTNEADRALIVLLVFGVSFTRVAPAALRIQQGFLSIRNSIGSSKLVIEILKDLNFEKVLDPELTLGDNSSLSSINEKFEASIELKDICYSPNTRSNFFLNNINLRINPTERIAFIGPTGSGKTTLVELILGFRSPNSGTVTISSRAPLEAFKVWPGAISYVPQDPYIFDGTLRENVSLGASKDLNDRVILETLNKVQMREFVETLPEGLETRVGEFGIYLSGGQRQRIGLARALINSPQLLILDEPTSALDFDTESKIHTSLQELSKETTIIVIAHRISTIKDFDKIIYLDQGNILATGTLSEIRNSISSFDEILKSSNIEKL